MTIRGAAVALLLLAMLPRPAQSQVMRCTESMSPIPDQSMQRSVDKLKESRPDIRFQSDDQPCRHARETMTALRKTLDRNYLSETTGYEFVKALNGEGYFTVERFMSRNPRDLQRLETALGSRAVRKLRIEANTNYDFFMVPGGIVLMISSAVGHDDNIKLFRQLQPLFSSPGDARPDR